MPHMFWLAALLLLGRAVDAAAPQPTRCDGWNCHNRVPKTVDPTKQDLLTKPLARVVPVRGCSYWHAVGFEADV